MNKGSKRKSWKIQRNIYNAISRDMARLAALHAPPAAATVTPEYTAPILRRPVKPRVSRVNRERTEREQAIHNWYFYGEADDLAPEGLTEQELMRIRAHA